MAHTGCGYGARAMTIPGLATRCDALFKVLENEMDYKKDRDNTVKLDINSDGCKDIWMVTEQENAYDKAVAVGRKKSKYSRF